LLRSHSIQRDSSFASCPNQECDASMTGWASVTIRGHKIICRWGPDGCVFHSALSSRVRLLELTRHAERPKDTAPSQTRSIAYFPAKTVDAERRTRQVERFRKRATNKFHAFHAETGEVLNWWPSTGTVQFQGKCREAFQTRFLCQRSMLTGRASEINFSATLAGQLRS
jgi:hypothetical protein